MVEHTLTLTTGDVNYLIEVLNGRPYAEVAALIPKIVQQVREQQQKLPTEPDAE